MKREYYTYTIHGALFLYLLFNFFFKEYSWHRNAILGTLLIGYSLIALLHHLDKNGKI